MKLTKYISLSVLIIFTTACSKSTDVDEHVESKVPDSSQISMMVDGESLTRAIPTPVENEADMHTVGFYCAYTEGDYWVNSSKSFNRYKNKEFTYDTGLSEWTTTNPEEWGFKSITDKYTFYAYSPYSSGSTKGIKPTIDNATGDLNIEDYTIPTATEDMVDLLVATPRVDIHPQSGGKVNMIFNHALSRVKFLAKVDKATFSNYSDSPKTKNMPTPTDNNPTTTYKTFGDSYVGSVKVTDITWHSLANKGTLKISANSASTAWTNHSEVIARNIAFFDKELRKDKDNEITASDITQEYLLIPQDCNTPDDEILVQLKIIMHQQQWAQDWIENKERYKKPYQVDPKEITNETKTKSIKLSQSSMTKIEMGKVYNLTIVIPTDAAAYETDDFEIKVTVSEWSDATVTIPNFN